MALQLQQAAMMMSLAMSPGLMPIHPMAAMHAMHPAAAAFVSSDPVHLMPPGMAILVQPCCLPPHP